MENKHQIIINWNEDKQLYIADAPDAPDCVAEGETAEEALNEVEKQEVTKGTSEQAAELN